MEIWTEHRVTRTIGHTIISLWIDDYTIGSIMGRDVKIICIIWPPSTSHTQKKILCTPHTTEKTVCQIVQRPITAVIRLRFFLFVCVVVGPIFWLILKNMNVLLDFTRLLLGDSHKIWFFSIYFFCFALLRFIESIHFRLAHFSSIFFCFLFCSVLFFLRCVIILPNYFRLWILRLCIRFIYYIIIFFSRMYEWNANGWWELLPLLLLPSVNLLALLA